MYIIKFVKIKTEFIDKDPVVVVLDPINKEMWEPGTTKQNFEIELNEFCKSNQLKLMQLIPLPAPLNENTLLQVGIFKGV